MVHQGIKHARTGLAPIPQTLNRLHTAAMYAPLPRMCLSMTYTPSFSQGHNPDTSSNSGIYKGM